MIGGFFGALPGTGPAVASSVSYTVEKKISKFPEEFGHGAIEGLSGPEAANNSAAQTSFIPTLTLGIPGDVAMIFVLSVLMIHGVSAGPSFFQNHEDIFWTLVGSFLVGNFLLLIMNIATVKIWVNMISIPSWVLYPCMIIFCCVGIYSLRSNFFDLYVMAFFGTVGYILRCLKFDLIPMVLGFILTPMIETNLRRTLMLSDGDFSIFIDRPYSLLFLSVSVMLLSVVAIRYLLNLREKKANPAC